MFRLKVNADFVNIERPLTTINIFICVIKINRNLYVKITSKNKIIFLQTKDVKWVYYKKVNNLNKSKINYYNIYRIHWNAKYAITFWKMRNPAYFAVLCTVNIVLLTELIIYQVYAFNVVVNLWPTKNSKNIKTWFLC